MIDYDASSVFFICGLRGSVFPKGMLWAIPCAILAVVLQYILPKDDETFTLEGVDVIWAGYTFVLGFLVVFRNSQAYSRFWEGATLIQQTRGEWFNAVSSLIAFCNTSEELRLEVEDFQHLIVHLMSVLFCQALQQICDLEDDSLEIIDLECIQEDQLRFLAGTSDRCEVVLQWLQRAIVDASNRGVVMVAPPILSRAFQELSRGIVNLNNVRKIKDVPFPFPYAQMIAVMLIIHFLMTPVIAAYYIKSAIWAGTLSFLVTGAFWSLVYIAQEIDHPFGEDANDFNISELMQNMNTSLLMLLQPLAQKPPKVDVRHLELKSSDSVLLGTAEVLKRRELMQLQSGRGDSVRVRNLNEVVESVVVPDLPQDVRASRFGSQVMGNVRAQYARLRGLSSSEALPAALSDVSGEVLVTLDEGGAEDVQSDPGPDQAARSMRVSGGTASWKNRTTMEAVMRARASSVHSTAAAAAAVAAAAAGESPAPCSARLPVSPPALQATGDDCSDTPSPMPKFFSDGEMCERESRPSITSRTSRISRVSRVTRQTDGEHYGRPSTASLISKFSRRTGDDAESSLSVTSTRTIVRKQLLTRRTLNDSEGREVATSASSATATASAVSGGPVLSFDPRPSVHSVVMA